jgi:hypothetical protein
MKEDQRRLLLELAKVSPYVRAVMDRINLYPEKESEHLAEGIYALAVHNRYLIERLTEELARPQVCMFKDFA